MLPGLISGYTSDKTPFPVPEEVTTNGRVAFNPQMEWTGGGMLSNTADLARWARLLYAGDVLKPATRTEMCQGVTTHRWPGVDYGLGVILRDSRHGPVQGHGGWFPGYVTSMGYYPELGLSLAVQVNSDIGISSSALSEILDDLADAIQQAGVLDDSRTARPLTAGKCGVGPLWPRVCRMTLAGRDAHPTE